MRFVANLRQETIVAFATEDIQPRAYLLSAHRVSRSALEAAARIRALNLPLFADNGTKVQIDHAIELFAERAEGVRLAVKELRKKLGRVPRGSDVPDTLRKEASRLAQDVVKHATDVSNRIDGATLLDVQLSMSPTDLIAQEDFATGCLIALGLERETTGWAVSRFDTRNRRSLRLWKRVASDPRCRDIRVYAVLSAMDYNTGRSVGRLAAAQGVKHAALGIAGIMRNASATDFFVIGTARITLESPAPRRHVRLAQVLRGIADGYADAGNVTETFHCLGLGASPMFPIAAAALSEATPVSTDATSPIHDAVNDRVLYDPEADGDRASTHEIVQRIVNGGEWPFLSPFSKAFRKQFGHDPERARASWEERGRPPITDELLGTRSVLTAALPLFSEADPSVRTTASKTRIAHNHWVLGEVCDVLADGAGRREVSFAAINRWLSRPASITTTRGLSAALRVLTADC